MDDTTVDERESVREPCVRCGGPSDTTVKGKKACNDCKGPVFAGKY
jgi:DnaJ-class molecular chaperone